jgi:uncharacterized delta-60 repeat protein
LALQTNGQILVGGSFWSFNGAHLPGLARLNADGSVDSTFGPAAFDGAVYALALQPDGKILAGGNFNHVNGLSRNFVVRLRPDGSADGGFKEVGLGGGVNAIALQADGEVVFGGDCGIARVSTNGTLDVTFNPALRTQDLQVNALGLQSDGKILVGGAFTTINGVPRNCLARLNTDGSVDTAFDAGVSGWPVYCLAMLPRDKILIGGYLSGVNGYSRNGIARLNADGSVDTTFRPGLRAVFIVDGLAVQADGRVLACGWIAGTLPGCVARLNTDGSPDPSFNPGADKPVNCVASQPDGKTLIGGQFTQLNGTNINGIARLNGDTSRTELQFLNPNLYFGTYLCGGVGNTYRIEWTSSLNTPSLWTPLFNVTLQANPQFIVDTNLPAGQRFYRAVQISP